MCPSFNQASLALVDDLCNLLRKLVKKKNLKYISSICAILLQFLYYIYMYVCIQIQICRDTCLNIINVFYWMKSKAWKLRELFYIIIFFSYFIFLFIISLNEQFFLFHFYQIMKYFIKTCIKRYNYRIQKSVIL